MIKTLKRTVCAWFGCSRIVRTCMGQVTCARCNTILGDFLTGCYPLENCVVVNHKRNCGTCREVATELGWQDTLLAPKVNLAKPEPEPPLKPEKPWIPPVQHENPVDMFMDLS